MQKISKKSAAFAVLLMFGAMSLVPLRNNQALASVPGTNTRISVDSTGAQLTSLSTNSIMSADGKFVLFESDGTNLVTGDTNSKRDVFLRDLTNNTNTRVSLTTGGAQITAYDSEVQDISENGQYSMFRTNNQIYLYNRGTGSVTQVSTNSSGTAANFAASEGHVNNDGRFVFFSSQATNLGVTITTSGIEHLFVKDLVKNTVSLLDQDSSGNQGNSHFFAKSVSCDGSFIVGQSASTNLTAGDTNGVQDVFLIDRRGGDLITNLTGSSNGASSPTKMSCNGTYIPINSLASNLIGGVGNGTTYHAYIYNRLTGVLGLVDQSTGGSLANDASSAWSASDDGIVFFRSGGTNLVSSPTVTNAQLYVRDTVGSTTQLLTITSGGAVANTFNAATPYGDKYGKLVTYYSSSTNLVSGDTNAQQDIFTSLSGF